MSIEPVSRSQRRWGAGLIVLGLTMALIVYGVAHFLATYQGLEYNCIVAGPRSALPVSPEAPVVTASFGHWPLGRECEWPLADGSRTVVARSDSWTGTFALGSSLLIALGGLVLVVVGNVTRRERSV